ncbi:MAG: transporter substrate-binding protein, partial [Trichodesmium sp. St4_bin8_1]|nr:transporter substrate-binding protein [Trichodesmium sp. St4_bin8_1]
MNKGLKRRKFLIYSSAALGTSIFLKSCSNNNNTTTKDDKIKVGILHSLSGTMAISETTVVEAE